MEREKVAHVQDSSGEGKTVQGNASGVAKRGREGKRRVEVSRMCSFPCGLFVCFCKVETARSAPAFTYTKFKQLWKFMRIYAQT